MNLLRTRWSAQVLEDPEHVLGEYPRPALVRESYINLNGIWEYAITQTRKMPEPFDGTILVPFSPEAPLSGVERQLKPREYLWYRRTLPPLEKKEGMRWILHFGAVDQFAAVFVNGKKICTHTGGYLPFSADMTDALCSGKNELLVIVRDATEYAYYNRGKQKLDRGGMFYTAQSGIWQTVWMEQVPENYIEKITVTPLYDEQAVSIVVQAAEDEVVKIMVLSQGKAVAAAEGRANAAVRAAVPDMHSWSPEDPFLYDLEITMGRDRVKSYFAMRKVSIQRDDRGVMRPYLNNQPYFQRGVLDQGYWPDGLYTAPTDEAMIFDIQKMKELGFNMLRKHIKIEPQRWYYHCDRLGMLVWQDMVCGGRPYKHWYVTYLATAMHRMNIRPGDRFYRLLGRREERGREHFIKDMKATIDWLYSHPSIVVWVIFNEGWGQFDADRVTRIAKECDRTRLFDQASGWFDQMGGDFRSIHEYFFHLVFHERDRIVALTEYGGFPLRMEGHSMCCEKVYGYHACKTGQELADKYAEVHEKEVLPAIPKGLSVTVYTQLSDIEEEVNGLYTYDRELLKIDGELVRKYNARMTL